MKPGTWGCSMAGDFFTIRAPRVELGRVDLDQDDLMASKLSGCTDPPGAGHRGSPLRVRRVVEKLAKCFRHEMDCSLPYHANERTDRRDRHYLFFDFDQGSPDEPDERAVGAAGFRWTGAGFSLAWVWLH